MIKFHYDLDLDTTAFAYVSIDDGAHHLFIINPRRLVALPCWAREHLANTLTRMALSPPPSLTAKVVDLDEFRQWCEAVNAADAATHSASV